MQVYMVCVFYIIITLGVLLCYAQMYTWKPYPIRSFSPEIHGVFAVYISDSLCMYTYIPPVNTSL